MLWVMAAAPGSSICRVSLYCLRGTHASHGLPVLDKMMKLHVSQDARLSCIVLASSLVCTAVSTQHAGLHARRAVHKAG